MDTRLEGGRLAGLLDLLVDVALGLLEHLLDARRVNAPVGDEVFQSDAPDLAAHGIERGQRDRLGRIVNDDVHPGDLLEGADVAPLAPDDATLHIIGRDRHSGDGALGRVVGGQALYGHGQNLARLAVGLALGLFLGLADDGGGLVGALVAHLREHLVLSLLAAHGSHGIELLVDGGHLVV